MPDRQSDGGPRIEVLCVSHSPAMNADIEEREGREFRSGLARSAELARAYDPTLVVMFGADHRRALTTVCPSITIALEARGFGDWQTPEDDYDIPTDHGEALAQRLVDDGLDIAVGRGVRLDHGFGLTYLQVFGRITAPPVLPLLLNSIGAPRAPMHRVHQLARSIRHYLREQVSPVERILVLASGGMSHTPPNADVPAGLASLPPDEARALVERSRTLVKPAWDDRILSALRHNDLGALTAMSDAELAEGGPGAHEIRNWYAAAVIGDRPLEVVAYEPVPMWFTGMGVVASPGLLSVCELPSAGASAR